MGVGAEQAPLGVSTVRARQPLGVERRFEPARAAAVSQSLVERNVSPRARIPHPARELHMSQNFLTFLLYMNNLSLLNGIGVPYL